MLTNPLMTKIRSERLAVLALALLVTACGGGSAHSPSGPALGSAPGTTGGWHRFGTLLVPPASAADSYTVRAEPPLRADGKTYAGVAVAKCPSDRRAVSAGCDCYTSESTVTHLSAVYVDEAQNAAVCACETGDAAAFTVIAVCL